MYGARYITIYGGHLTGMLHPDWSNVFKVASPAIKQVEWMDNKHKMSWISGILVVMLDLYWTYIAFSAGAATPEALGVIIFVLSLVWLWAGK